MECVFEERREHAALVVVGLQRRAADFEELHDSGNRQLRDGTLGEVLIEALQVPADTVKLRLGNMALLEFVLLGRVVVSDGVGQRLLVLRFAVVRESKI